MGEVVNVVVAFAVIVFLIRWATRGGGGSADDPRRRARDLLGFQPKNVTPEMISTVQTMFPDIPRDNIQYDLLKTGNVQMTSNKLLERGYLDAPPPPYFQLFPSRPTPEQPARAAASSSSSTTPNPSKTNLVERYNLEERVHVEEKYQEAGTPGGKAVWEESAERREASLRERKAQMVLAARRRFLEQHQQ